MAMRRALPHNTVEPAATLNPIRPAASIVNRRTLSAELPLKTAASWRSQNIIAARFSAS
jgi:hypothetical protein